jgi:hypothetical protein
VLSAGLRLIVDTLQHAMAGRPTTAVSAARGAGRPGRGRSVAVIPAPGTRPPPERIAVSLRPAADAVDQLRGVDPRGAAHRSDAVVPPAAFSPQVAGREAYELLRATRSRCLRRPTTGAIGRPAPPPHLRGRRLNNVHRLRNVY